jgi:hypothetical protein
MTESSPSWPRRPARARGRQPTGPRDPRFRSPRRLGGAAVLAVAATVGFLAGPAVASTGPAPGTGMLLISAAAAPASAATLTHHAAVAQPPARHLAAAGAGRAAPQTTLASANHGSVLPTAPATPTATAARDAATHGAAASSCTVSWTGPGQLWTDPKNWSTGKIPGASDNVCIINPPINDTVLVPVSVSVHSLLLGLGGSIDLQGTAAKPVTLTVATTVTMTKVPAIASFIQMENATLKAAQIISDQGTIFTAGTCHIISPHVVFADQSALDAFGGTATLSSLSELSNGTLTGASVLASDQATVVLPGDITRLASAQVAVLAGSVIDDPAGHTALSGLTSIDARSSLEDNNNLALTGSSFTAGGAVDFGPGTLAIRGPFTQAGNTLILQSQSTLSARSVTISRGASFADVGTVASDLVNEGKIGTTGTVHVTGNYTQAPGATLFSGFGSLLTVTGEATLAGSVSATETFAKTGDTTPLITFGSLAGDFTSHPLGLKLLTKAYQIDGIQTPQLAVSPATVSPGQAVTVRGGGFTLNQDVRIFLDKASGTPLPTGVTVTSLAGGFAVTATIPASLAAGPHRLIAVATDGEQASAPITVR